MYLPFYAFEGTVVAKFTGRLGYRVNSKKGRNTTFWWRRRITLKNIHFGVDTPVLGPRLLQYAGFEYRRKYVQEALIDSFGVAQSAQPLSADMMPYGTGVAPIEAKPSYMFQKAKSEIFRECQSRCKSYLKSNPDLVFK